MKEMLKSISLSLVPLFFFCSISDGQGPNKKTSEKVKGYVEVHQHLWTSSGPPGAPGMRKTDSRTSFSKGRRRGLKTKKERENEYKQAAKNLLKTMDKYGVERAFLTPPPRSKKNIQSGELDILFNVSQLHPDRFYVVGGGDELNSIIHDCKPSEVSKDVKKYFKSKAQRLAKRGIKAFGEMAVLHLSFREKHVFEETPADHPLFLLLADIAAQKRIPIHIHMQAVAEKMKMPEGFSSQNPEELQENISGFEKLLKHNRKTKIVWLHGGWDQTGDKSVSLIRKLLKKHTNLFISLRIEKRGRAMDGSPLKNRVVNRKWQLEKEWLDLFKEFPDRFMIGSDEFFAPAKSSRRAPQSFEETWRIIDQLPNDLANKIGRDNAARIYDLN